MTAVASLNAASAAWADRASEAAASALIGEIAASPTALRTVLKLMPKGGDLHNHLGGSVYAEDFIRWGAARGQCVGADGASVTPPPCATGKSLKALSETDPIGFDRLVDALSTRGYQQGVDRDDASGHTQFFGAFDRFGALDDPVRSEVVTRQIAAGDRVGYLELMANPTGIDAYVLAAPDLPLDEAGLAAQYARELPGLGPVLTSAMASFGKDEAAVQASLRCGTPAADPACSVTVHYLTYALRDLPPAQVFRSLLLAFALADRDPRFVGANIVMPEDWPIALRDYDLHMAMIRFLVAKYPRVHRTLHAGELAFGLVPPADQRDHIRKAIEAGAERIGHGTGIALEDDALGTMARMAREGIAVEINLTSNDVILGVKGPDHPLALYRRLGVPVALSTDDEGVLRTDMTNEYVRAVRDQGLSYTDLKELARASLEYAFLPGASLWAARHVGEPVPACAGGWAAEGCERYVRANEKARLERALEQDFDRFERVTLPQAAQAIGAGKSQKKDNEKP